MFQLQSIGRLMGKPCPTASGILGEGILIQRTVQETETYKY